MPGTKENEEQNQASDIQVAKKITIGLCKIISIPTMGTKSDPGVQWNIQQDMRTLINYLACLGLHLPLYGSDSKESTCNVGDPSSIPGSGSGRSLGEGNGNPLQYYCLKNSIDREPWRVIVHGISKGQTQLSDFKSHDEIDRQINSVNYKLALTKSIASN